MNSSEYEILKRDSGRIILEEKIHGRNGDKPQKYTVRFHYEGEVIVFKFDRKNPKGNSDPLYHFLKDDSKPWAKRCDFIVFQLKKERIWVFLIEFKSGTLPDGLVEQLKSSENWCRSLYSIIRHYTGHEKKLFLKKFVFSDVEDPNPYVDKNGYLIRDHSVRHYRYEILKTMSLDDLEHDNVITVG